MLNVNGSADVEVVARPVVVVGLEECVLSVEVEGKAALLTVLPLLTGVSRPRSWMSGSSDANSSLIIWRANSSISLSCTLTTFLILASALISSSCVIALMTTPGLSAVVSAEASVTAAAAAEEKL